MKKRDILKKIIEHLEAELALYAKSARAAHEEATHEQSKAENKYDTRGLEASYLAHGQSPQVAETEQAWEQFKSLKLRDFAAGEGADIGALVELKTGSESALYFIGPRAGGLEVKAGKSTVLVITPQSPLGRQLMGKTAGETFVFGSGPQSNTYRMVKLL